MNFFAML